MYFLLNASMYLSFDGPLLIRALLDAKTAHEALRGILAAHLRFGLRKR
jgi:hypothetical protein